MLFDTRLQCDFYIARVNEGIFSIGFEQTWYGVSLIPYLSIIRRDPPIKDKTAINFQTTCCYRGRNSVIFTRGSSVFIGGVYSSRVLDGPAVPIRLSIARENALISSPLALSFAAFSIAFLESTSCYAAISRMS